MRGIRVGMRRTGVRMLGNKVGMRVIWVEMRGIVQRIRVEMQEIGVGIWEIWVGNEIGKTE